MVDVYFSLEFKCKFFKTAIYLVQLEVDSRSEDAPYAMINLVRDEYLCLFP